MYVGVDYHKRYTVATQMDLQGVILSQVRLKNDPAGRMGTGMN